MKIRSLRGLPAQAPLTRQYYGLAEEVIFRVLAGYGYRELGLSVLEPTELFARTLGEATDLVEKEMYTFADRKGASLTLRPEGTAGCVRTCEELGLLFNQVQRLWYRGPMFRYERPQKGRYRQFEQLGAECFGMAGPEAEAELLLMSARIWRELGVAELLELELNSLGNACSRQAYRAALLEYLAPREAELDEDSRRRLHRNPLRILDSKVPKTRELLQGAPTLDASLDEASRQHLDRLRELLDEAHQPYRLNTSIVRGLDYYNHTVFEWTTRALGAQGAVCSGGRYDGLAEQLGARPAPAVGFALGLDRLALLLKERDERAGGGNRFLVAPHVYLASLGWEARKHALLLGERMRSEVPGLRILVDCGAGGFKNQLKRADASGAELAVLLGEDELAAASVTLKPLRTEAAQRRIPERELAASLRQLQRTATSETGQAGHTRRETS